MDEFAKMIYEQWFRSEEAESFNWGDYDKEFSKLYDILSEKVADAFERSINKKVWDVQEKAFIAGFSYACRCLSNGKIEFTN